jgi:hypothetical protein
MRAALLVGLVACAEPAADPYCPAGETCSPLAPYGADFSGPVIHYEPGYTDKIALGGTARFTLWAHDRPQSGEIHSHPIDAYVASVDTPAIALEQNDGAVTLHALATSGDRLPPGTKATLEARDADGLFIASTEIETAEIADITRVIATGEQYNNDPDPVFVPGAPIAIGLWDASNTPDSELWDESMRITGAPQLAWDLLEAPAVTGTVTIAPGGHAPVDLTIPVAATDVTITNFLDLPPSISTGAPVDFCFVARSGGHQVYGATWTYTVNGVAPYPSDTDVNCITVTADSNASAMTVVVSAAGASLTVSVPVI